MKKFVFLEHTADIKFQSFGKDLDEAFSNAAFATTYAITESKIEENIEKTILKKADDLKSLLYDFIEELLFFVDSENFLLASIKSISVNKKHNSLKAVIMGDVDPSKYDIKTHIKAVTYNEMVIDEKPNGVTLQVVLDI